MAHPIFDAPTFRRDLPEARALEEELANWENSPKEVRTIAQEAKLPDAEIEFSGAARTLWQNVLNKAATIKGGLLALIERIEARANTIGVAPQLVRAIEAVRKATIAGTIERPRLLLDGNRPFLGRKKLREYLPKLQDWDSPASVLVVRGDRDSGRSETQVLLAERNSDRFLLLDQGFSLKASMRAIWKKAGATGDAPVPGTEALSTESALLMEFWNDVLDALETTKQRLWVLFDDLDKGPGRDEVRLLAEVLAIRLGVSVAFQRRLRVVMLGYPNATLPSKIPGKLICDDATELFEESHVQAFLDYCLTERGMNFNPSTLPARAADLCAQARALVTDDVPYHEALHGLLTSWHKTELE